ncbi:MAG TPA: hypothetical protein VJU60_00865 [Thermoleophilaceae bacterium]|nr:hypothetical protein [Thermoleophilaceae bacterium]
MAKGSRDTGSRMSRDNVDLVLHMYESFNRADLGAVLAADGRSGRDRAAARRGHAAEMAAVEGHGDMTLGQISGRAHGVASATPTVETWSQSIRWPDGPCIWWRNFATEADALKTIELEA